MVVLGTDGKPHVKPPTVRDRIVNWLFRVVKLLGLRGIAAIGLVATVLSQVGTIQKYFRTDESIGPPKRAELSDAEIQNLREVILRLDPPNNQSLKLAGVLLNASRQELDIRVVNSSENSIVINEIAIAVRYLHYTVEVFNSTESHDLDIRDELLKEAKDRGVPFEVEREFLVSYLVRPKDADRYLFKCNLAKDKLHFPDQGEYKLIVAMQTSEGDVSHMLELDELLEGRPWP